MGVIVKKGYHTSNVELRETLRIEMRSNKVTQCETHGIEERTDDDSITCSTGYYFPPPSVKISCLSAIAFKEKNRSFMLRLR